MVKGREHPRRCSESEVYNNYDYVPPSPQTLPKTYSSHVGQKLKLPQGMLKHTPLDEPGTEISNVVYHVKTHAAIYATNTYTQ